MFCLVISSLASLSIPSLVGSPESSSSLLLMGLQILTFEFSLVMKWNRLSHRYVDSEKVAYALSNAIS